MKDKEINKNIRSFNLEHVVSELNIAMDNADTVCPYPEYAGMVRNDIMKTMAAYMNKLSSTYICQDVYKVEYKKL